MVAGTALAVNGCLPSENLMSLFRELQIKQCRGLNIFIRNHETYLAHKPRVYLVDVKLLNLCTSVRDVVRFSNPDGQAVMCWALSALPTWLE